MSVTLRRRISGRASACRTIVGKMAAPVDVGERVYYHQNNGNTYLGILEYSDSSCYVVRDDTHRVKLWKGTRFDDLSKNCTAESSVCLTCRTGTKPLVICDECFCMFHTACNIEHVPEDSICYYCFSEKKPPTIVKPCTEEDLKELKEDSCKPTPVQQPAPPPPTQTTDTPATDKPASDRPTTDKPQESFPTPVAPPPNKETETKKPTTDKPQPKPLTQPVAPPPKKETQTNKPVKARRKVLAGEKGGIESCVCCGEHTDMQCGRCGTCFCSRRCMVEGQRLFRHHVDCYIAHLKITDAERAQGCKIYSAIEQRACDIDRLIEWRLPSISNPVAGNWASSLQPQQQSLLEIEKRLETTISTMELLQKTLDSYHTDTPTLYGGDKIPALAQEKILGVSRLPRYPACIRPHGLDTNNNTAASGEQVDGDVETSFEPASKRLKIG